MFLFQVTVSFLGGSLYHSVPFYNRKLAQGVSFNKLQPYPLSYRSIFKEETQRTILSHNSEFIFARIYRT